MSKVIYDSYDYSVLSDSELLAVVRDVWNEEQMADWIGAFVDVSAEHRLKLALTVKGREPVAPPAAPDSSIPQPLAELAAARERIRELEAALKSAETHIEAYRNSTHMPPSLYVMLTDVSLMIGSTLKGESQP